jgi:[NiFe] hydrogenase assembly HybE family chaperone
MHRDDPSPLLEATFERIRAERMAGMTMLNPALVVAAIGFERHGEQGEEWRGVLVTPWGINLLLLPATEDWLVPAPHERVFRSYPAGTFAFLGNREEGLGDYLACPLIHDMQQFADQETAVNTARACLIALDLAPAAAPPDAAAPESPARRKMFGLRS